jgi:hypothetical protein
MDKQQFAKDLMRSLLENYGRVPSAAIVARDFNLRVQAPSQAVSQETARRWLRGISLPDYSRLMILVKWLNLQIAELTNQSQSDLTEGLSNNAPLENNRRLNAVEMALVQIFRETDLRGKKTILSVANTMIPGRIPPTAL